MTVQKSRFAGRVSAKLIAIGVSGIIGTAAMIPQMISPQNKSASPPATSAENLSSEPVGGSSAPVASTPPIGISPNFGPSPTPPAGGSAFNREILIAPGQAPDIQGSISAPAAPQSTPRESFAFSLDGDELESDAKPRTFKPNPSLKIDVQAKAQGADQSPRAAPLPNRIVSSPVDNSLFKTVKVYYATDRNEINLNGIYHWSRILLPVTLGGILSIVMVIALRLSQEKYVWGLGLTVSAMLTLFFGYQALIYSQQTLRLKKNGNVVYGSRRFLSRAAYPLHLGISQVTIPKIHQTGKIERPTILKAELIEREDRHITLQSIEPMLADDYFADLKGKIDSGGESSVFVFIHGYNVVFDDAIRRTAQISADLKFEGAPILYSWPSSGNLILYTRDEANVSWTVTHLEQFLWDVRERTGAKNIHLIAHSMGNRAMLGAIERMVLKRPESQPLFGQIVMAAPDVDLGEFEDRYAVPVDQSSRQATLYASESDRALIASHGIHGYKRLGEVDVSARPFAGIDMVNVTPIDPSLLGHSYYGDQPLLLNDLRALVELGHPPSMRQWLMQITAEASHSAWRFRPEVAGSSGLLAR